MQALDLLVEPTTVTTTVVHLAGELDGTSADQLIECIGTVGSGVSTIVLDLHKLTFLDSMGISVLIRLHRELDCASRLLQVRNLRGHPLRVFDMTELHRTLQVI